MAMIEPNKCIIEDSEILAFENEEQLNFYTIWHEALVDKRRELNAISDRERQIIKNEIARKTRQLISIVGGDVGEDVKAKRASGTASTTSRRSSKVIVKTSTPVRRSPTKSTATASLSACGKPIAATASATITSPRRAPTMPTSALAASRRAIAAAVAFRPTSRATNQSFNTHPAVSHQRQGSANLPNGLTILNSSFFNTVPSGKQLMKYKLTKLYNKYRGRQLRRNLVNDKQMNARIEVEISKSYLNSWLTYTALQALRLPEPNINSLNATTINSSHILTPFAQPNQIPSPMPVSLSSSVPTPPPAPSLSKKTKSSAKKQKQQQTQQQQIISNQMPQFPQKPPLHLVYIDPGNIITYSNRINPQQVAEYKQKSHLLPSSATSKKSSAASYDVYEIMEVLANTNKTNVTITRNANRSTSSQNSNSGSIYSHSVNANTPGIVSTQLHLQARSYLDIMSKFYAEESKRLEEEKELMNHEPSVEDMMRKYLNID